MVNLVNVVSSEISKVLKNRQICTIEFTSDNDTIQIEMAAKIAMWIENILKDTGDRMLENELRAKIEKERKMGKEGHIATLIEKYLYYDYKERDLEEEEGPVLDFIDELMEKVMVETAPFSATNTKYELEDKAEFGDGSDDKVTDEHSSGGAIDEDGSFGAHDNKMDEIYYDSNDIKGITSDYDKDLDDMNVDAKDTDEEITDTFQPENQNKLDDNGQIEEQINPPEVNEMFEPENTYKLEDNEQTEEQMHPLEVNDMFQPENAYKLEDSEQTQEHINPLEVKDIFQPENVHKLDDNEQSEKQINGLQVNDTLEPGNTYNLENNQETEKQTNPAQVKDVFQAQNANKFEDNEQPKKQISSLQVNDVPPPENANKLEHNKQTEEQINPLHVNDEIPPENANKSESNEKTEEQRNPVKFNDNEGNLDVEQVGINTRIEELSGVYNLNNEQPSQISVTMDLNENKDKETYDRKVKFTNLDPESEELGENAMRPGKIEDKTSDSWNIPSDIIFAPPNHGLLSDADELWPDKHAHGIGFKFSESVSKSVTSLGHIQENDERFIENAEQDEESTKENLGISNHFTDPVYAERTEYDIIAKPSETTTNAEGENLIISTNINSIITAIVSDTNLIKNKYSEDESVDIKYDGAEFKVEIKKKASPVKNNDMTEIIFDENNTQKPSRISSLQDNAFYTGSVNDFAKDNIFVIDDGKGDNKINENESTSLTNTNKYPAEPSKKNLIYQVPASSRNVFHRSDDSLSRSSTLPIKIGQCQAQRWCSDLERTADNLCHWYKWIDDVCNKMMTLQDKSALPRADVRTSEIFKEWVDLQSAIDNDAVLWNKLKEQTKIALQIYRKNVKPKGVPKYRKSRRDAIFDRCIEIDGLTMWMDSLATTTEYCMKCKCKYFSRKR